MHFVGWAGALISILGFILLLSPWAIPVAIPIVLSVIGTVLYTNRLILKRGILKHRGWEFSWEEALRKCPVRLLRQYLIEPVHNYMEYKGYLHTFLRDPKRCAKLENFL